MEKKGGGGNAYLLLNPYIFENPRNGNWIENKKRGKNAYLLNCLLLKRRNRIASKSPIVAEDEQRFLVLLLQRTNRGFLVSLLFFPPSFWIFFSCMVVGLEHVILIWICSEEMELEVRVSLNFDREIRFGFLGLLFFFFFLISGLVFLYKRSMKKSLSRCNVWFF